MKKLVHFSEGVRESLRRLSSVTWMAEELHKVADYVQPNLSVSTQTLSAELLESFRISLPSVYLLQFQRFLFLFEVVSITNRFMYCLFWNHYNGKAAYFVCSHTNP